MPLDDAHRQMIEVCLKRIERRRRSKFTAEQRERVLEVADADLGRMLLKGISRLSAAKQSKRVEGLVRMALIARRETIPVPDEITSDVLNRTPDTDLANLLYDHVCTLFSKNGVYKVGGSQRDAVSRLPRGQRIVYTLYTLDGTVQNGGFGHFFENSRDEIAQETLENCRLVGANKHAVILERAIELWDSLWKLWNAAEGDKEAEERVRQVAQTEIVPQFNGLNSPYYGLEQIESLGDLITQYLRKHPEECLTARDGGAETA